MAFRRQRSTLTVRQTFNWFRCVYVVNFIVSFWSSYLVYLSIFLRALFFLVRSLNIHLFDLFVLFLFAPCHILLLVLCVSVRFVCCTHMNELCGFMIRIKIDANLIENIKFWNELNQIILFNSFWSLYFVDEF